jgi:hypothetical protein
MPLHKFHGYPRLKRAHVGKRKFHLVSENTVMIIRIEKEEVNDQNPIARHIGDLVIVFLGQ